VGGISLPPKFEECPNMLFTTPKIAISCHEFLSYPALAMLTCQLANTSQLDMNIATHGVGVCVITVGKDSLLPAGRSSKILRVFDVEHDQPPPTYKRLRRFVAEQQTPGDDFIEKMTRNVGSLVAMVPSDLDYLYLVVRRDNELSPYQFYALFGF
jgi:hypothetical protein